MTNMQPWNSESEKYLTMSVVTSMIKEIISSFMTKNDL